MISRQILRINDDWAIAADGLQWMLQRRWMRRGQAEWQPVSFVSSTRDILARCMREKGVPPEAADAALKQLPPSFAEWQREAIRALERSSAASI